MSFKDLSKDRKPSQVSEHPKQRDYENINLSKPNFVEDDLNLEQLASLKNNLSEKTYENQLWRNPYAVNNYGQYNNFSNFKETRNQPYILNNQYSKLNQYKKEEFNNSPYFRLPESKEPKFNLSGESLGFNNENRRVLSNEGDLVIDNYNASNKNLFENYMGNLNNSFSEELSKQGISFIVFLFALLLSSLNLGLYRKFAYIYEYHENRDLFLDRSFLYKELLVFAWRCQMILLFLIVYLALIKITEVLYLEKYGELYVEQSLFFQIHGFKNISSFLTINNFVYSAFNSTVSFMLILSTAFMPVSLTVLITNSDRFFSFVLLGINEDELSFENPEETPIPEQALSGGNIVKKLLLKIKYIFIILLYYFIIINFFLF